MPVFHWQALKGDLMKSTSFLLATAIGVLLSGCGGGGGGGSEASAVPAPVATPPATPSTTPIVIQLNAAISALFGLPHDFNNTVKSANGDTFDARVAYSNIVDTNIENQVVKSVDIKRTVSKNGSPFFSSAETSFFQLSSYRLVATKTPDNPLYVVASNQITLPPTAKPGDSGAFYNATTYDSIGKNVVLSTAVHGWSVAAESATTVLFCDNSTVTVAQVSGTTTRSDCYQIDADSNVVSNRLVIPGAN